jgi:hypothetical protein
MYLVAHLRGVGLHTVNSCVRGKKHLEDLIPAPLIHNVMQLYAAFIINLKNKNMNAREKASELIVTYQIQCKSLDYQQAKECALIAVDEILKSHTNLYIVNSKKVKFYLEVKNEIKKL